MHGSSNDEDELWRHLDWNDVRTFLAVAETGSLNAAAGVLKTTQPTISRRMEDLEYRLGARLFHRTPRGVSLTEAGETVHDLASSMARFGDSIVRNVRGRDRTPVGRVRVAAPDGLASYVMMPRVAEFQMANPEIHLAIDCGLWPESPFEGDTDISVDMSGDIPADVVSTPIATIHYCLFASAEYLSVYGTPKSLAEVADHRWVRHTSHKEQPGKWHPKAAAVGELAGQQIISNSSATTFQAIKHGAGIGSLPTYVLTFEPNLVMLDLEPMAHPVLFLRHHASAARQNRIMRVKDWIMNTFDASDKPWYREEFIHPRDFDRARARPMPRRAARTA